ALRAMGGPQLRGVPRDGRGAAPGLDRPANAQRPSGRGSLRRLLPAGGRRDGRAPGGRARSGDRSRRSHPQGPDPRRGAGVEPGGALPALPGEDHAPGAAPRRGAPALPQRHRTPGRRLTTRNRQPTTMTHRDDPLSPPVPPPPATGRPAPVPKRKRPGPYRVPPREGRHGLLIVNAGDGQGKGSAALGLLLRATGRDMRVGMWQFVKSAETRYGEHLAAERLGVEIVPLGVGFTWLSENVAEDRALAERGWEICREALRGGTYDVLIFDELTYPLRFGW